MNFSVLSLSPSPFPPLISLVRLSAISRARFAASYNKKYAPGVRELILRLDALNVYLAIHFPVRVREANALRHGAITAKTICNFTSCCPHFSDIYPAWWRVIRSNRVAIFFSYLLASGLCLNCVLYNLTSCETCM